jgi:hypothetical protein
MIYSRAFFDGPPLRRKECTMRMIIIHSLRFIRNAPRKIIKKIFRLSRHLLIVLKYRMMKVRYIIENDKILKKIDKDLHIVDRKVSGVAGVFGRVDNSGKFGKMITAALDDGMREILLFTVLLDGSCFSEYFEPLLTKNEGKIKFVGAIKDKKWIYGRISDLYCSKKSAYSKTLEIECRHSGVSYHAI